MNIGLKISNFKFFWITFILLCITSNIQSAEIVKDRYGNYYLIKEDGSYKKLPPLQPGKKYVLKPTIVNKQKKQVFKKVLKDKSTRSAKRVITRQSY